MIAWPTHAGWLECARARSRVHRTTRLTLNIRCQYYSYINRTHDLCYRCTTFARRYTAHLQFVPYPPTCHVRGLLVRPWVVPRGTSSIVPGSSGTLHHCPAPLYTVFSWSRCLQLFYLPASSVFPNCREMTPPPPPPITHGPSESTDEAETCLIYLFDYKLRLNNSTIKTN